VTLFWKTIVFGTIFKICFTQFGKDEWNTKFEHCKFSHVEDIALESQ